MEKGTELIYASLGFNPDGNPCYGQVMELKFDQFNGDRIIGITEDGFIKSLAPDNCKLKYPEKYFSGPESSNENAILG